MSKARSIFDRAVALLMLALFSFNIVSCSGDIFGANTPVSISISKSLMEFDSIQDVQGSVQTLSAEVQLRGGGTSTDIKWSVGEDYASQNGIKIVGSPIAGQLNFMIENPGQYEITASSSVNEELKASCIVNVKGYVTGLQISLDGTVVTDVINVTAGDSFTLEPVFTPADTTQQNIRWSVDNDDCLTIGETSGAAVAKAAGQPVVTLTSLDNPEISTSIRVNIRQNPADMETPATLIALDPKTVSVPYGNQRSDEYMITAYVTDGYQNTITTGEVTWSSDNPEAIQLAKRDSRSVYLLAVGPGSANITASYLDEGEEEPVIASAYAYTEGSIQGLRTDSTEYTFPLGYKTSMDDIIVQYQPEDTLQKGYTAVSDDTDIARIISIEDDYLILQCGEKEGSTSITITSDQAEDIEYTFTVNVKDMVSPADRISKITLSRDLITIDPPFTDDSDVRIQATTWIFQDNTSKQVEGSYDTYGIRWESLDESVFEVRDEGNGIASVSPVGPGSSYLRAYSVLDDERYAEVAVEVTGTLTALVPATGSVSVMTGRSVRLTVNPVPAGALMSTYDDGSGNPVISARLSDNITANAVVELEENNTLSVVIEGRLPGRTTLTLLADGMEMTDIPVTVTPSDEEYMIRLSASRNSVIMRQDSDAVVIEFEAENQDGDRMSILDDSGASRLRFTVIEDGEIYDDLSQSRIATFRELSDGSVSVAPRNSGVTVLRAYSEDNEFVSAEARIEIGGSDVKGGDLRRLMPYSAYMQVQRGSTVNTGVNFIPSDYSNKDIDWDVTNAVLGEEPSTSIVRTQGNGRVTLRGENVGKDIVTATADSDLNTSFTVETVDGDAYRIELDRFYLSYDRNQKADPVITATVYKNNVRVSDAVEWTTELDADIIEISDLGGNQASVHLKDNDELGEGTIRAYLSSNPSIFSNCFVEVIDSFNYETVARAITADVSSMIMTEGAVRTVDYSVVPSYIEDDEPVEIIFTYSEADIVSAVQEGAGKINVTANKPGRVDVKMTIADTSVSDTFTVTVVEQNAKPASIRLDANPNWGDSETLEEGVSVINLNQEYMDGFGIVKATILGTDGKPMTDPEVLADVSFEPYFGSSRYFDIRTVEDNDDLKGDIGSADYWGNDDIADNEIRIKPRSVGSSYIRVSYPGLGSVLLNVTVAAENAIYQNVSTLLPSSDKIRIAEGGEHTLYITAIPESEGRGTVEWSSDNSGIADISSTEDDGFTAVITGAGIGETTIHAKRGDLETSVTVVVEADIEGDISAVTVNPQHVIFDLDSKKLTLLDATVFEGGAASEEGVDWDIASDLSNGMSWTGTDSNSLSLTKGTGEAKGYITVSSKTDPSYTARVYAEVIHSSQLTPVLQRIQLSTTRQELLIGDSFQLTGRTVPQSIMTNEGFDGLEFTSSNDRVASVETDGTVTANAAGNAIITVSAEFNSIRVTAECEVIVEPVDAATIVLSPSAVFEFSNNDVIPQDAKITLYSSANEDITGDAEFTWTIEDPSVATITPDSSDSSRAVIRVGSKQDVASRFTVTCGSIEAQGYIVVGNPPDDLIGLIVNPSAVVLAVNERADFEVTPVPAGMADSITIEANAGSNILSLEDKGNGVYSVTAVRQGNSDITFIAKDKSSGLPIGDIEAVLDVRISGEARAESIMFSRGPIEFETDAESAEVTATIISDSGREFAGEVDWSIDSNRIAGIAVDEDDANTVTVTAKGIGTTMLRASYGTIAGQLGVSYAAKGISTATSPTSIYAQKSSIILNHPDNPEASEESKKADIEVGFFPSNLSDAYKGIIWTLNGTSIDFDDAYASGTTLDGHIAVKAVDKGVTTITATSAEDDEVQTTIRVEVLGQNEIIEDGIPTLELDKYSFSLKPGGESTIINAILEKEDGSAIIDDEGKLSWESDDEQVITLDEISPFSQKAISGNRAGEAIVTARYLVLDRADGEEDVYISASAAGEVYDPAVAGQPIRDISLSESELVMIAGGNPVRLDYTITPNINVPVEWSSDNPDIAEVDENGIVRALDAGSAIITIKATQSGMMGEEDADENGDIILTDTCIVTVSNGIPESSKWESFTASSNVLTMSPYDTATMLEYTLTSMDGGIDGTSPVSLIRVKGETGVVYAEFDIDDIEAATAGQPLETEFFSLVPYGDPMRRLSVNPKAPGIAIIEVYVFDKTGDETSGGVFANTYVTVTGELKDVGIPTKYIYMAVGDTETISISPNPSSAIITDGEAKWLLTSTPESAVADESMTVEFQGDPLTGRWQTLGSSSVVELSSPYSSQITVRAKAVGEARLQYEYENDEGVTHTAYTDIMVLDRDSLAGGVRKISFPSSYSEIPYPYSATQIQATVTFFDGTESSENITYSLRTADGEAKPVEDIGRIDVDRVTGIVTFTPLSSGNLILKASYDDPISGTIKDAEMEIIVRGAVSRLIPSYTNVVLYTGGSIVLSVEPDDEDAPGLSYEWRIVNESGSPTAFEPIDMTMAASDSSSIVLATKDIVVDPNDPKYDANVFATYPRTATLRVTCPEYNVSTDIAVTVKPIDLANAYPKSLEISDSRLVLEPPFDPLEAETMTATVLDRDGNEIPATVDWYWYRVGDDWTEVADGTAADAQTYKYVSWLDPSNPNHSEYVNVIFQQDTKEIYYTPLQAGQYYLMAVCRENPVLRDSCVMTIGGDVTGISADVGLDMAMVKGESATVNAVFTPDNALARDPLFLFASAKNDTFGDKPVSEAWITQGTGATAKAISLIQNGETARLTALAATQEPMIMYIEYWDTATMAALDQAAMDSNGLTGTEYRQITGSSTATLIAHCSVGVTVANPAQTIQQLSIVGLAQEIDPSEISSAISFTVTATPKGGDGSAEAFDNWDWIDVDIVGAETGYVYATSRTVEVEVTDTSGQKKNLTLTLWGDPSKRSELDAILQRLADGTPEEGDEKLLSSLASYFDSRTRFEGTTGTGGNISIIREPIANNGILRRNERTYSFILNSPNGIPSEAVIVKAYLHESYQDGYDDEGEYLFDKDKLAFSGGQYLSYIGCEVTEISAGTTTYNVNNNETSSEGSNIDLILGANARLTVEYNPSFTHQKGVIWYVAGGDMEFKDFEAMPGASQCSVFARAETEEKVILRALSIYDPWFDDMEEKYGDRWSREEYINLPRSEHVSTSELWRYPNTEEISIYYDYQITIRSPIQQAKFISKCQTQVNKPTDGGIQTSAPIYAFLNDPIRFPDTETQNEIVCYDSTGATGTVSDSERVDAYYINVDLQPPYGYELNYEIIDGTDIGSLDYTDIDKGTNTFRFVPRGPQMTAEGGTAVTYGDVQILFTCPDLNFSKVFTLHYLPANIKLVKWIGSEEQLNGSFVPDYWTNGAQILGGNRKTVILDYGNSIEDPGEGSGEWDVYYPQDAESNPILFGMENIILYPHEVFPVSLVSFFNDTPMYVADGVILDREGADDKEQWIRYATMYTVYEDQTKMTPVPGYLEFGSGYQQEVNGTLVETEKDTGISGWFWESRNELISTGKQGRFYLAFTMAPIVEAHLDEETGQWIEAYVDTSGATGTLINNGVWVYVVEPVDQVTAGLVHVNNSSDFSGMFYEIPGSVSLGNLRPPYVIMEEVNGIMTPVEHYDYPSKWFNGIYGALVETVQDSNSQQTGEIYRGKAWVSFGEAGININGVSSIDITEHLFSDYDETNLTIKGNPIRINSDMLRSLQLKVNSNAEGKQFINELILSDADMYDSRGLDAMHGLKAVDIEDNGTVAVKQLGEGTTLDLSNLRYMRYYKHTLMMGYNVDGTPKVSTIKTIIPPVNIVDFRIPDNNLTCDFQWGTAKGSLAVLDISGNPFPYFGMQDFTNLKKVFAEGSKEGLAASGATNKYLDIYFTDRYQSQLELLSLGDSQFNHVVAEFRDGTGHKTDLSWPTVIAARNSGNGGGSDLRSISVSGGIGYADLGNNTGLDAFIVSDHVTPRYRGNNVSSGEYNEFVTDSSADISWVQFVNLRDSTEPCIIEAKGSIYQDQLWLDDLDLPWTEDGYSMNYKAVPSNSIQQIKLSGVGYLSGAAYGIDKRSDEKVYDVPISGISSVDIKKNEGNMDQKKYTEEILIGEAFNVLSNGDDYDFYYPGTIMLSDLDIKNVSSGANVYIGYSNVADANVQRLSGSLDLSWSENLRSVEVTGNSSPTGTLIVDGSGISSLDDIKGKINTLSIDYAPDLVSVEIKGSSDMMSLRKLSADGAGYQMVLPNGTMGVEQIAGNVRDVYIAGGAALEELSISGGWDMETATILGEKLQKIDLSNAGLYGRSWQIGNFNFVPGRPINNIDNYAGSPDADYTRGYQMFGQVAKNPVFSDIKKVSVQVSDNSDTGYHYEFLWRPVVTSDPDNEAEKIIDWKTWLPNLTELKMFGNTIGFQWITGKASNSWYDPYTFEEAMDDGYVQGTITIDLGGLYRPNEKYLELEEKSEGIKTLQLYSYSDPWAKTKMTKEEKEEWQRLLKLLDHYYIDPADSSDDSDSVAIRRQQNNGWVDIYYDNGTEITKELFYRFDPDLIYKPSYGTGDNLEEIEAALAEYFIKADDMILGPDDEIIFHDDSIGRFDWRDQSFSTEKTNSMDGHENDYFSVRFGTIPEELMEDPLLMTSDGGTGLEIIVHNKYKGSGWFSEASRGYLEIEGVRDDATYVGYANKEYSERNRVSDILVNGSAVTQIISLSKDADLNGGYAIKTTDWDATEDGMPGYFVKNGQKGIIPSGIMVDYHHYDQNTKFYDHDSATIIYPFGK